MWSVYTVGTCYRSIVVKHAQKCSYTIFSFQNTFIFGYLFNEVNARLKVKPKVYELPFNALLPVLLLLQDKHVVIEELL